MQKNKSARGKDYQTAHCCSEENVVKSSWKYATEDTLKLLFYDTKSQLQFQGPGLF